MYKIEQPEASMAHWVLECASCKNEFTHSEIVESHSLRDPFTLNETKPEFPDGGLSVVCPICKETGVYQRHELLYRAP